MPHVQGLGDASFGQHVWRRRRSLHKPAGPDSASRKVLAMMKSWHRVLFAAPEELNDCNRAIIPTIQLYVPCSYQSLLKMDVNEYPCTPIAFPKAETLSFALPCLASRSRLTLLGITEPSVRCIFNSHQDPPPDF